MKQYLAIIIALMAILLIVGTGCNQGERPPATTGQAITEPAVATSNAVLNLEEAEAPTRADFTEFGEQPQTFTN